MESTASTVKKRAVLYVSGFDPQGAPRYHRLYKEHSAKQAVIGKYSVDVGQRKKLDAHCDQWKVRVTQNGSSCDTDFFFARWDDIVRANWPKSHWSYIQLTLKATWAHLMDGSLFECMRTSLPGFRLLIAPVVLLLGSALLMLSIFMAGWSTWWAMELDAVMGAAVAIVCAAAAWGVLVFHRRIEHAWFFGWTVRSLWFNTRLARGHCLDMQTRMNLHAKRLLEILKDPSYDEILVVGHSSGAMMATSVVGKSAQQSERIGSDERLRLLTLGGCFAIWSYMPVAEDFRREVADVAQALSDRWIDVTSPADHCCGALVDPCDAVRVLDGRACQSPKLVSPQFAQLFTEDTYAALKKRPYDMHFQYLQASERLGWYDYFAITAGTQSLLARTAGERSVLDWTQFQCLGGPFAGRPRAAVLPGDNATR
jgi:hypothetical protein